MSGSFSSRFIVNGTDTNGATALDINNDASPLIVGAPLPVGDETLYDAVFTTFNKDGFVYKLDASPTFTVLDASDGSRFSVVHGISDTDGSSNWQAGGMMSCPFGSECSGDPDCQSYASGQYWTDDSTIADPLTETATCPGSSDIPRTVGFAVSDAC